MPLSGQTLKIGMQGEEVKLLHDYLRQLGYANQIPEQEISAGSFDKGTAEAVAAFQQKNELQPTGEVDAQTAKAINTAVEALRPKPESPTKLVVKGEVHRADGNLLAGVKVQAFDKDLRTEQPLGDVLTDAEGRYEISYTAEQFRRAEKKSADLVVRAFPENGQSVASNIIFNAPPVAVVDLMVGSDKDEGLSEYERYMAEIAPLLENIKVADLNDDDNAFLSGETGIDRQHITFLAVAARHGEKTKLPPEVFYGFAREGLPTSLPALLAQGSEIQRRALESALEMNIIPARLREELENILAGLKQRLVEYALQDPDKDTKTPLGALLSTAVASTEKQHTFLTLYTEHKGSIEDFWKKLGENQEFKDDGLVERLQFTLQLGALTSNNAPLVEALRNQHPALQSTRELVDLDVEAWQGLIRESSGGKEDGIPPYIAGKTPEEKTANYAGSIVETLRAAFPTRYVAKGLSQAPAIDAPLVKRVIALNKDPERNESLDLRKPLPENLNWGDIPQEEHQRAREAFAVLRGELLMFPDLKDEEALAGQGFTNLIRAGVRQVLKNDSDFDFSAVNIDKYLEEHKDKAFAGIDEKQHDQVTNQLKAMQRVYQVTPRFEDMQVLMSAGLDSAVKIGSLPPEPFIRQVSPLVGGEKQARIIYDRAETIHAEVLTAYGVVASAERDLTVRVIGDARAPQQMRATYPNLFGALGLCACEHCRSVYSPAAYLVDLLQFLNQGPWQLTLRGPARPVTVLQWRRPDILHIPLTCENSNTLIPYVDLVNEILEAYIAHPQHRVPDRSLGDAGTATSEELLASPQRVEDAAYNVLKSAVFPFTLPFDRNLETVRVYLEHLGTSRYAVMRTFQPARPLTADAQTDLAIEYLKIGPDDRDILTGKIFTGPSPRKLAELYGYPATDDGLPPVELEKVAVFLERTGLSYKELAQILRTRFINPAGAEHKNAVVIADPKNSCDTGERYLRLKKDLGVKKDRSLTLDNWDSLQRFTRLWRKLGWAINDVDRALTALGVTDASGFDPRFLRRLGQAVQLRDDLTLSLEETLSLWANIDTLGNHEEVPHVGSLYASLFLNSTVRDLAVNREAFALNASGTEPRIVGSIASNDKAIQAALRITAAELSAIREGVGFNDELTLGNLSALHRHAALARALRMTVRDLLDLQTLTGVNPFAPPPPTPGNANPTAQEGTARFVELARKVQRSGFSVALLNYLHRHRTDLARNIGLRPEQIVEPLTALRAELRKVAPDGGTQDERTRRLLTAVMDPADVDEALGLLNGTATYTATLTEPPAVAFPRELGERIRHSASTQKLSFTGAMTLNEQRTLRNIPGHTLAYQGAIDTLFEQPRTFIRDKMTRFLAAEDAINQLIDGVRGATEAARVSARHDYVITKALDLLSPEVVVQTLSGALGLETDVARVLLTIALRSRADATKAVLADFLALRLPVEIPRPDAPEPVPESACQAFVLLHKAALLVTTYKLTAVETEYLAAHASDFSDFNLNNLPVNEPTDNAERRALDAAAPARFAGWERLFNLVTLRDGLPRGGDLVKVYGATSVDAAKRALRDATGWDTRALDSALGADGLNVTDHAFFANELSLLDLAAGLDLAKRIGVAPARLFTWAATLPDAGQAQEVQSAVKAKYEARQWLAVAKSLNDPLRERRRDALVAYVLTLRLIRDRGIRTVDELFEFFLIDVKMNACMATSRIKQAISSVQLFIQRCFMKLEDNVPPNALRADWWEWMSTYRVWEANRKVFLYPENWVEPELRDDKSPFFKEFENELLQNDVTDETAEAAFLGYLEKLDEVARLDIRGMYWEHESELTWDRMPESEAADGGADGQPASEDLPDPAERADVLHVFGRTQGVPPIYYYRRLINHKQWTPWEKVQTDIEGDHLIPVVYNRRLCLFWTSVREAANPNQAPPPRDTASRPEKWREITLAWSEYKEGKWSAKTTSKAFIRSSMYPNGEWPKYTLTPLINKDNLFIGLTERFDVTGMTGFAVTGCDRELEVQYRAIERERLLSSLPFFAVDNQQFTMDTRVGFYLWNQGEAKFSFPTPQTSEELQRRGLGKIRLTTPRQGLMTILAAPFFYQDRERTYFVTPEQVADVAAQIQSPSMVRPVYLTTTLFMIDSSSAKDMPHDQQTGATGSMRIKVANTDLVPRDGGATALQTVADGLLKTGSALDARHWTKTVACPGDRSEDHRNKPDNEQSVLKLRFHTFYHPHVCELIKALKRGGVPGLLTLKKQKLSDFTQNGDLPGDLERTVFRQRYNPTDFVDRAYPKEDVDFEGGAYAQYNWELFFHIPLLIATRLSANQRFEEARRWFHFIFDPTTDSTDPIPQRFWKTLPFYRNSRAPQDRIADLLRLLSYRRDDLSPEEEARREQMREQVREWRDDPFNPHHIARMRLTAYQKTVVMKYIDNLIAWGDQLFRQDTIETINQATQLYVLAYLMLGKRPEIIPPKDKLAPQSYAQLRPRLDEFSNALVATENSLARRGCVPLTPRRSKGTASGPTLGTLYFCVPHNDKLLGYWDTVEDRLFKIRHCMNIEGVVRQLPLFEPPIDPGLLVRARAAGLDLRSVLNDINAGLPHYRFVFTLQKALELCGEVRSLGGALLAAYEKKDAEEFALLRSTHEIRMLEQVRLVRQKQIEEADEAITGLEKSKLVVEARRDFYRDIAQISGGEQLAIEHMNQAHVFNQFAQFISSGVAAARLIPEIDIGISGWAASPVTKGRFGGSNLGHAVEAAVGVMKMLAAQFTHDATQASTLAGYDRRWDEWKLQERLANRELDQIDKQILAARIRKEIARQELRNHELQIEQAKGVDEFMRARKFTRKELYDWMVNQLSAVYFQSYQLAYDMAKQAERAYRFERGVASSGFVRFGQWDSLRRGLLAGEQLALDLKRLEVAYLDQNKRDYEINKQISLVLLDPLALIALKETGRCVFRLPESLFDMDYPGHYMRRIRSVSLTIPSVRGPYTGINCTLTLLSNKVRTSNVPGTEYLEQPGDDSRFEPNFGAVQSIATSHAQNDAGVFELNFRDERYLPFEGAGVISEWLIEMPKECNAFDFDTISDVIINMNYTAREGGDSLRRAARDAAVLPQHLRRLFSMRHEFATEWHRFLYLPEAAANQVLSFKLTPERFPFQLRGRGITIKRMDVFLKFRDATEPTETPLKVVITPPATPAVEGNLASDDALGGLPHAVIPAEPAGWDSLRPSNDQWSLAIVRQGDSTPYRLSPESLEEIILVCHYSFPV